MQLPELWASACFNEEDDPSALILDPLPQWITTKTGYAEYHKMMWLSRQGALQSLAFRERLLELTNRRSLESSIASLSAGVPIKPRVSDVDQNTAEESSVADLKRRLTQMRRPVIIQSDLKSAAKNVHKILRSLNALQSAHFEGSPQFAFVGTLLCQPWAEVDLSFCLRKEKR